MSRCTRKPTIHICGNQGADQISAFVFATRIVQSLFFLYLKFQASSLLLWLYRPVCVRPGRNQNCWFSHAPAHIYFCLRAVCWPLLNLLFFFCETHLDLFKIYLFCLMHKSFVTTFDPANPLKAPPCGDCLVKSLLFPPQPAIFSFHGPFAYIKQTQIFPLWSKPHLFPQLSPPSRGDGRRAWLQMTSA